MKNQSQSPSYTGYIKTDGAISPSCEEKCNKERAQKAWDKKYGKNSSYLMGYVECHCPKCEYLYNLK